MGCIFSTVFTLVQCLRIKPPITNTCSSCFRINQQTNSYRLETAFQFHLTGFEWRRTKTPKRKITTRKTISSLWIVLVLHLARFDWIWLKNLWRYVECISSTLLKTSFNTSNKKPQSANNYSKNNFITWIVFVLHLTRFDWIWLKNLWRYVECISSTLLKTSFNTSNKKPQSANNYSKNNFITWIVFVLHLTRFDWIWLKNLWRYVECISSTLLKTSFNTSNKKPQSANNYSKNNFITWIVFVLHLTRFDWILLKILWRYVECISSTLFVSSLQCRAIALHPSAKWDWPTVRMGNSITICPNPIETL